MKILVQFGSSIDPTVVIARLIFPLIFVFCGSIESIEEHYRLASVGYFHEALPWEDWELQHLSSVKGPNFHANGFHVINATFPARKTSYIIHLSKTQGLFHPEQLEITAADASQLDCFYSGTVTEITGGVYTNTGIVSLSTCHHDMGFEGLVLLPQEQYYIRPHESPLNRGNFVKRSTGYAATPKPTVPHKAYKVNSPNSPYKQNVDEILRVPPEELQKASQNQSHNQDTLDNEESDDNNDDEVSNELQAQLIEDEGCDDDVSCKLSLPPVMAALSSSNSKNKEKKIETQNETSKKGTFSLPKVQVVEIAVFTDTKLYTIWQDRYPKDTMTKMKQYVLAVINNMNALYKQPSMTEKINFRLVYLEVETSKPASLKDHKGHAIKYLKSFCSYAAEKNQNGRLWDHALLLTGFDILDGGSNSTAGIAWFSTMCINGYSCSLIEGFTFGSTFITSHEIGHSLGMEHDGSGSSVDCDSESFIMSPTTGGGKTDWSPCSVKNMKDFISGGYQGNPKPACIFKRGSKAGKAIKFSSGTLPGEQFSAQAQCSADCKQCTPYINPTSPYDDMCHLLYCQEIKGRFKVIRSTHPALEGTPCAKGKTCRIGKCE